MRYYVVHWHTLGPYLIGIVVKILLIISSYLGNYGEWVDFTLRAGSCLGVTRVLV